MKKILPLIMIFILLSSCITRFLHNGAQIKTKEDFQHFFISKHKKDLVFIGKKYHYVFRDRSKEIAEFTKPEWKSLLEISHINLDIDTKNNVNGKVSIETRSLKKLTYQQISLLKNNDFKEKKALKNARNINNKLYYNQSVLAKTINLNGVRYKPYPGTNYNKQLSLSRRYKATINISLASEPAKVLLTPVTVSADGFLILYGSFLIGPTWTYKLAKGEK